MFKTIFTQLCAKRNISPSKVCEELGYSNSVYSKWSDTSTPRRSTLIKIAEYFGVSVEYLIGEETDLTQKISINELSEQEKMIIEIFRSTSEEGRLEMIAAFINIKNSVEKKTLLGTPSSFRTNTGA